MAPLTQVCTNLNNAVTSSLVAQVELRSALTGREAGALPPTRSSVSRIIDVERRWARLAPKAYHIFAVVEWKSLLVSKGVVVSLGRSDTSPSMRWAVWDLRNSRDLLGDIPCQAFTADRVVPRGSERDCTAVSCHSNLIAFLGHTIEWTEDKQHATIKVYVRLYKLFSDTDDVPTPHPEAARPVLEVASFTIPAEGIAEYAVTPMHDDKFEFNASVSFSLQFGHGSTLLVQVRSPRADPGALHALPIATWNWRTGTMVMVGFPLHRSYQDLRVERQFELASREYFELQGCLCDGMRRVLLPLPDDDVLVIGMARSDALGVDGLQDGPCVAFGLFSSKTAADRPQPSWIKFQSPAVAQIGPTVFFAPLQGDAPSASATETALIRWATRDPTHRWETDTAVSPWATMKAALNSSDAAVMTHSEFAVLCEVNTIDWKETSPFNHVDTGGLRVFLHTVQGEPPLGQFDCVRWIHVASYVPRRAASATPLASRRPAETEFDPPVPVAGIPVVGVSDWHNVPGLPTPPPGASFAWRARLRHSRDANGGPRRLYTEVTAEHLIIVERVEQDELRLYIMSF